MDPVEDPQLVGFAEEPALILGIALVLTTIGLLTLSHCVVLLIWLT
jgi:uncharacterized membrane protein YqjE